MLFNSLIFIFAFLPASLIGYYAICASSFHRLRFVFLSIMSLLFYTWASYKFALLLCASTLFNLVWAKQVEYARNRRSLNLQRIVLVGVTINIIFLSYFKYTNFFIENIDNIFGLHFQTLQILLPIGISFYTFMFIGTLIDVARGDVKSIVPGHFISYALFYPHLLAGPLIHYQELVPQMIRLPRARRILFNLMIGLILFAIGLFKKTVLADTYSIYADNLFKYVDAGHHPTASTSWLAALSFTLQIYFDFSGYSDMAIGIARMFGFKFPLNFYSPFKATNIADYWRRWHMSLNRFIISYLYPALSISFARWSIAKGFSKWPDFAASVATPSIITFVVLGAWHGAGWTFIVFGLMHGCYVVAYEVSRAARKKGRRKPQEAAAANRWWLAASILTLLSVVIANVMFRASSVGSAWTLYRGMLGLGTDNFIAPYGALGGPMNLALVLIGALIVFLLPNSSQLLTNYAPVLEWRKWRALARPVVQIRIHRTMAWALASGLLLFFGIVFVSRAQTVFIYFQF